MFSAELPLSSQKIKRCRDIAKKIGLEVSALVKKYSTVGIERAALRMIGFNDALQTENLLYPISNHIVDELAKNNQLKEGALFWVANALLKTKLSVSELQSKIIKENFKISSLPVENKKEVLKFAQKISESSYKNLIASRKDRKKRNAKIADPIKEKRPLKYVIVATGNIFEDVLQAKSAVKDGADSIAVIRSTAQSLLDYVPQGHTTEGFGGTYATQANFNLMRSALDEVGAEVNRYIRLTNYCSGLCMSEIAALASMEGLDFLLNDAMYGILFRDINMKRTLVDQHFSRLICGVSDIWIMTGEDNYMKTTDAVESGDQVLASEFINERAALNANMKPSQMCIGHAMEMDPSYEKVILMEIARAQMTRQIFPTSPLKYMCNTKYKTGDIFMSHAIDTIFNFIGGLTDQGVSLLGMPTEAIHTPFLHDRSISLRSANYVLNGMLGSGQEFGYNSNGFMAKFSQKVLDSALKLLEKIEKAGFLNSIEKGNFADIRRPKEGGKGGAGVFEKAEEYCNPFYKLMYG
jgi:beta-lysine 5,6-aminomutase alpha subunit